MPSPTATGGSSKAPADGVDGRTFVSTLTTVDGTAKKLVNGTAIRITFADGRLSANAGCNTMGGDYAITNGQLVLDELAATEMGCQQNLMDQDTWLAAFLTAAPALALAGNELTLASDTSSVSFLDREQAEPDQPLTMITWGLSSIIDKDIVSSVPTGASASLLFKDDGTVQIDFGCNAGSGHYTVDGDEITFSRILTTMMACLGPKGEVESAVTAVIHGGPVKFSIDSATLTLTSGDNALQYSAAVDLSN